MAKKIKRIVLIPAIIMLVTTMIFSGACFADTPTDEIIDYEITADVNDDATVNLVYHVEWKVLESDDIGPLSWVSIGIPSDRYVSFEAISDNITDIEYSSSGGSYLDVYFDRDYYEGEIISFDYKVVMDNMYQMNSYTNGITCYSFTPGWFPEIAVDNLTIRWQNDKLDSWDPDCLIMDGYNTWTTSLEAGDTYNVKVYYSSDAFAFDDTKTYTEGDSGYGDDIDYDYDGGTSGGFVGFLLSGGIGAIFVVFLALKGIASAVYRSSAGFGGKTGAETKRKVTRTKIEYYPECQGCGAPRGENEETCSYCGRSFIKSEEVIDETKVSDEDKEALKYDSKGEYHYSSNPNTFVRVNVINVPIARASHSRGGSGPKTGGRSGGRSSGGCAHSSCACASCACACACACAGGGRAGCTTKDFYKTDLKLTQLELKQKHRSHK